MVKLHAQGGGSDLDLNTVHIGVDFVTFVSSNENKLQHFNLKKFVRKYIGIKLSYSMMTRPKTQFNDATKTNNFNGLYAVTAESGQAINKHGND